MKNLLIIFMLMLIGCAPLVGTPTPEQISKFGIGEPLTIDYKAKIKSYFQDNLKDPDSAKYEFQEPEPTMYMDALSATGLKKQIGYGVKLTVNAKNSFGGYNGKEQYIFIFKNNELVKVITPNDLDFWGK